MFILIQKIMKNRLKITSIGFILFILLTFKTSNLFASIVIKCNVRYQSTEYREPTYYEGTIIGKQTITSGYYENVWSSYYLMDVMFYSGEEANKILGKYAFNSNSIVAIIKWSNGGSSIITIRQTTQSKTLSSIDFENIYKLDGIDSEQRRWEIKF